MMLALTSFLNRPCQHWMHASLPSLPTMDTGRCWNAFLLVGALWPAYTMVFQGMLARERWQLSGFLEQLGICSAGILGRCRYCHKTIRILVAPLPFSTCPGAWISQCASPSPWRISQYWKAVRIAHVKSLHPGPLRRRSGLLLRWSLYSLKKLFLPIVQPNGLSKQFTNWLG